jgi:hypothetical protein
MTNPAASIVEQRNNTTGVASFVINTSTTANTITTSPITLTVSNQIIQEPNIRRVGAEHDDTEWSEAYGRAVDNRLREVVNWVKRRHETLNLGWEDTNFIEREWVAAQIAAKHQAMRDALDWSSSTGWHVYPKISTTASSASTISWNSTNTDFHMPPEYLYNNYRINETATTFTEHVQLMRAYQRKLGRRVETRVNHHGNPLRSFEHGDFFSKASSAEIKALHLLRKMVPNDMFRRYLRHGFITVRGGTTGLTYQVHIHRRIAVWDVGTKVAELCIHLNYDSKTPPTDHVVGKMLMAECDEAALWKKSNITWLVPMQEETSYCKLIGLEPKKANEDRVNIVANTMNVMMQNDRHEDMVRAMRAAAEYIQRAG